MKAAYTRYGPPDVLEVNDLEKPVPKDDEVLVRIRAASVNPLDWKTMKGGTYLIRLLSGQRKAKIKRLGVDLAGSVEAVGKNITQFKPGDDVFGTCRGAFAEYACATVSAGFMKPMLVLKPDNVTFEQAASAPVAALTALQGLRDKGRIQAGQKVLINGAAGGVGTYAVQIAKSFGAHVTGVCSSRNVEMVRGLGADHVIDYSQEDFTRSGQRYDLIFDGAGNHSLSECGRVESQGNPRPGRSTPRCSGGRSSRSFDRSDCLVVVREPEATPHPGKSHFAGPDHHRRAHFKRESDSGH